MNARAQQSTHLSHTKSSQRRAELSPRKVHTRKTTKGTSLKTRANGHRKPCEPQLATNKSKKIGRLPNSNQEQEPWQHRVGRLVHAQRQVHLLQLAYNEATALLQKVQANQQAFKTTHFLTSKILFCSNYDCTQSCSRRPHTKCLTRIFGYELPKHKLS